MGKKKKTSGASAGENKENKGTQLREQVQSAENIEQSLKQRSRFATEHLKQLEELYREGLNLEDEILAEEELSAEELQGALDELETMQNVRDAAEDVSESDIAEGSEKENDTAALFRPETDMEAERMAGAAEVGSEMAVSPEEQKSDAKQEAPEFDAEASEEEKTAEGIALDDLTSAEITLGELEDAGITRRKPEDAESTRGEPEDAESIQTGHETTTAPEAETPDEEKEAPDGQEPQIEALTSEELAEVLGVNEKGKPSSISYGDAVSEEEPVDSGKTGDGVEAGHGEGTGNSEGSGGDEDGSSGDSGRRSGLSKKTGMIQITVFFITLFGISIVGLCMPLRPTESQIEKRTLTEFPDFSWESFLSGDYTDQISTWYADTFPFRETLLSWYTDFKKLFGIQGNEVYIGDVIVADEIPDIPEEDETASLATDTDATDTDAEKTTTEAAETTAETTEAVTETTEAPTETTTPAPDETTTETQTTTAGSSGTTTVGEQVGSVYIYGDQAFSVYGFSLEMSDNYAKMISLAAEELAGKATVYNILVPLSYGIQLDSSVWESMGWSDEEKAIKYMYSQMSNDVKTVSVYQALLDHKDEYIYFRTDHHWTALGAYYAYQCFASAKGITANALDSYETMTFENYLGSLYSQSNESEALANNPDTITAYVPRGTNKITITQKDGSILDWRVIYDVTTWRNDSKYSCFIGGDNPFSVIENPEITDGSSVLLVKESFGNAFAPFLVDHYQYVYIIDFRYYSGHLEEVVDSYGIQDVIFMNNLNSAGGSLQNYLKTFIEPEEETSTGE